MIRHRSYKYLRTFLSAARFESFRSAAAELHITASAVSHQIKTLEQDLGVQLFDRGARSLNLTPAGHEYAQALAGIFAQLDDATEKLIGFGSAKKLRLGLPPFFANELFLPKLSEFTNSHPQIDLEILTVSTSPDLTAANIDLAISAGQRDHQGYACDRLFQQWFVLVCSESFRDAHGLQNIGDLNGKPIIALKDKQFIWQDFANNNGLLNFEPASTLTFDTMSQAACAAEQDLGVALLAMPMAQLFIRRHRLLHLFECEQYSDCVYCLLYQEQQLQRPEVQNLSHWIKREFTELA